MQSTGHMANGLCPCCNDSFSRIRLDLVEISRLVEKPLPEAADAHVGALLAGVRESGLRMLTELNHSLNCGTLPPYPIEFEGSVNRFGNGIDKFVACGGTHGVSEAGVFQIYALRFALAKLAKSMRDLVDELNMRPPDRIEKVTNGPPVHKLAAH